MQKARNFERGAVSLFVVIVSALLITTVTVAFIRIMIQDQQQAQANDLSKSALDSAYAGIEDAKRLLVQYRKDCPTGPSTNAQCANWADLMKGQYCDTLQKSLLPGTSTDKEVLIQQSDADKQLLQAYTCVKVVLNTDNVRVRPQANKTVMIPLKGEGAFDHIDIEWFSQKDLSTANAGASIAPLPLDTSLPKWNETAWPKNLPPLLRLQLIQYSNAGFNLSDFDKNQGANTNNATLFLKPGRIDGTGGSLNFADNIRQSQGGKSQPILIKCDTAFSTTSTAATSTIGTDGMYACKASITIPNPIDATDGNNRTAYLRIGEVYSSAVDVRVSLWSGGTKVLFSGVQPTVDATGRANDLFRRIKAWINLGGSDIPQIEAAVDISGSLCKTFLVTDKADDYQPGDCQD